MRVLAIDPGGTTGMADLDMDDFRSFQLPWEEVGAYVHQRVAPAREGRHLHASRPHVIVCESFTITAQTAKKSQHGLVSVELIGVCRYLATAYGVKFVLQSPAEAKGFSTDAKLKAAGWYARGQDHARDAARHLLLYCAKNDLVDLRTLMSDL